MAGLAGSLSSRLHGVVLDQTGIAGQYDIDLHWATDSSPADEELNLQRAVREELGLVLKAGKSPVSVFVVDDVANMPIPD